jgi:RNA polymerase sigma-70 factor (ECF subfamily)
MSDPLDSAALSDLDLVRGIKAGDDRAFEQMVERYHGRVYSLAYGVLRNAEDAEESTSDAFLTLYRKIGSRSTPRIAAPGGVRP